jgi:hypothetical protein
LLCDDCGIEVPELQRLLAETNELMAIFATMAERTKRNTA